MTGFQIETGEEILLLAMISLCFLLASMLFAAAVRAKKEELVDRRLDGFRLEKPILKKRMNRRNEKKENQFSSFPGCLGTGVSIGALCGRAMIPQGTAALFILRESFVSVWRRSLPPSCSMRCWQNNSDLS